MLKGEIYYKKGLSKNMSRRYSIANILFANPESILSHHEQSMRKCSESQNENMPEFNPIFNQYHAEKYER